MLEGAASTWPPADRLFRARVRWLEEMEGTAATTARAEELDDLVEQWIGLVRSTGREREPGQMAKLLADLGPMPSAQYADDRALYVAALINPLPALGVALEIRPAALAARTALERLEVAKRGIKDSIARLERSGPTFP